MTPDELRKKLNDEFGVEKEWPHVYVVDSDTYARVCSEIFTKLIVKGNYFDMGLRKELTIVVGLNGGVMFKGVELLLRTD